MQDFYQGHSLFWCVYRRSFDSDCDLCYLLYVGLNLPLWFNLEDLEICLFVENDKGVEVRRRQGVRTEKNSYIKKAKNSNLSKLKDFNILSH